MAYVIEMPPVVIQEIQDYERASGRSLEASVRETAARTKAAAPYGARTFHLKKRTTP